MIICFKFVLFNFLNSSSFLKNRLHPNWSVRTLDLTVYAIKIADLSTPHAFPNCRPVDLPTNTYMPFQSADLPTSLQHYAIRKCRSVYLSATLAFLKCRPADLSTTTCAISICRPLYRSIFIQIICEYVTCPQLHTCMPFQSADLPTSPSQNVQSKHADLPTPHAFPKC